MVTIAYLLVFNVSVLMVAYVDTFFYDVTLIDSILYVIMPHPSTNKGISIGVNIIAFFVAVFIDYRVWKKVKMPNKQVEGK